MNLACCCTEHGLTLAAALSTFLQALIHGLNRHYYSLAINYRKTPLEERMLGNLQASTGCCCCARLFRGGGMEERMLGNLQARGVACRDERGAALWCLGLV